MPGSPITTSIMVDLLVSRDLGGVAYSVATRKVERCKFDAVLSVEASAVTILSGNL